MKGYLQRKQAVPPELFTPIPDPWKAWTATDPEWLARQAAKKQKRRTLNDQPDDVEIITDTAGDPTLSLDKILLDDDSDTGSRFGFNLEQENESDLEDDIQRY